MNLFTFGDSILDSEAYSGRPVAGDLIAESIGARLHHFAVDGATSHNLVGQLRMAKMIGDPIDIAIVTIGGNDFLTGSLFNGVDEFGRRLGNFLIGLPKDAKAYVANVYDPTFGDNSSGFLGLYGDAALEARKVYHLMNQRIAATTTLMGYTLVDIKAVFDAGTPKWYANTIEPSKIGVPHLAQAFLKAIG